MDRQNLDRPAGPPSRTPHWHRPLLLALVLTLTGAASGCQILIGVLMSLGGRPLLDADFKEFTGKKMPKSGKKVVVLCTSPENAQDVSSLDLDIIAEVSGKMRQHDITLVDPHKIQSWIDDNGGEFEDADLVEIGRKFDVDYIVKIKLDEFTYMEANTSNMFRGRAKGSVTVMQIDDMAGREGKKRAKKIYDKVFSSTFPDHAPVSSEQISAPVFRKQFLQRVSDELSRLFYDHRPGENF